VSTLVNGRCRVDTPKSKKDVMNYEHIVVANYQATNDECETIAHLNREERQNNLSLEVRITFAFASLDPNRSFNFREHSVIVSFVLGICLDAWMQQLLTKNSFQTVPLSGVIILIASRSH